jgi:hypothetical protein
MTGTAEAGMTQTASAVETATAGAPLTQTSIAATVTAQASITPGGAANTILVPLWNMNATTRRVEAIKEAQ